MTRHSRTDVRPCRPAEVSYVPEVVVARPGDNVTVFCVINDRSVNASAAVWRLNMNQTIPRSQYQAVNQRVRCPVQLIRCVFKPVVLNFLFGKKYICLEQVSQITVRSSENKLDYMLQCRQGSPYSQIYVQGEYMHCPGPMHLW